MNLIVAKLKDEELAYNFVCELEETFIDKQAFHDTWKYNQKDSAIHYYFLEHENQYVGFCSLRILFHLHHSRKIAQVEEFIVHKQFRNQGFARFMFETLIVKAQNENCLMIELSSNVKRKSAHLFYEHLGMQQKHYKFTLSLPKR